jgi:hypothetical protein
MKSSVIRGLLIFAAGAASAALASGLYPPEPITPGEFQERAIKLIAQVEELGAYVAVAENGRIGIYTNPYACIPPVPPVPVWPVNAVDPSTLETAARMLVVMNHGLLRGETSLAYEVGRCKPYPGLIYKK